MAFLWVLMEGALLWGYLNLAQLVRQQRLEDTLQCSYLEASLQSEGVSPSPAPPRRVLQPSLSALLAPDRDDGVGEPTVPHTWRRQSSPAIQARWCALSTSAIRSLGSAVWPRQRAQYRVAAN